MDDYVLYHNNYEIPRNYVYWSALALIASITNRKIYFAHGDIIIRSNLYIMLVGPQGNGKSVSCIFAKKFFRESCPDYHIGASTQSAEDIVSTMAKADFSRVYKDESGNIVDLRAYAFYINEFKNFIAYAPSRMLAFLTDIYDVDYFDSSTIKRGIEGIPNPSLNILACENPDWLVNNLKSDIVSGGFSRRIIYVYETDRAEPKAFIDLNEESLEAKKRIIARLVAARSVVGKFQWTENGRKWFLPWYNHKQRNLPANPLMAGYVGTKHIQLFKVAMGLDAISDKPMLVFTDDLLQESLAYLDVLETNMPKLSLAAGRNELAITQQRLLEAMSQNHGMMSERDAKRFMETDVTWSEGLSILRHLEETEQIVKVNWIFPDNRTRWMFMLPDAQKRMEQKGEIKKIEDRPKDNIQPGT